MTGRHYEDAEAFRSSLDQRILTAARETGMPHDRLRKDVAFQRLVARFVALGDDRWAIKGAVGLLWRVGREARTTRDIDANWLGSTDDLELFLDSSIERDLGDWFDFELTAPRPVRGEMEGTLRYSVTARLAGREFAAFRLDVNLATEPRSVEAVAVHRPLLDFVGLADLTVPMISIGQQLAEKLHAVTRTYPSGDSSRAKDAYDSLLLAQTVGLPPARLLGKAVETTFAVRDTQLLREPPDLPDDWDEPLGTLLTGFAIPGVKGVDDLKKGWTGLWKPILDGSCSDSADWDQATLSWT